MDLSPRELYTVEFPPAQQRNILLVPYDLVLTIPPARRLEIGRFSLGLLAGITVLADNDGLLFKAGAFCQLARGARILLGGEHRNDTLINYSLTGLAKIYRLFMDEDDAALSLMQAASTTEIGDNVIVSTGAIVISGARIGSGSVLAAGGVASGSLPPLGIYGGVPARKLKDRMAPELYDAIRLPEVMAHDVPKLYRLLADLQSAKITIEHYLSTVSFLPARPTVHMTASVTRENLVELGQITGYSLGSEPVTDEKAIGTLNAYFAQMLTDSPKVTWAADIFCSAGLYERSHRD